MLISQFRSYLTSELRCSHNTVTAYIADLEDYERFLQPQDIVSASKKEVRNYMAYLSRKGLENRSINRKLSSVKSFYRFLLITGTIQNSPAESIKSIKYYNKVQIPFTVTEMNRLFDSEFFYGSGFRIVRDRLVIEILYHTGMRKAELIHLRPEFINLEKKEIKVVGKGQKERLIPINEELVESIRQYQKAISEGGLSLKDYFFVTGKGEQMYPKLVYEIVNSYLSFVTEKNKKSPHMLRHSIATHLLHNGAEINAVKEILGHANLAATQIYTHNDIEHLKKVFNRAHPRESK